MQLPSQTPRRITRIYALCLPQQLPDAVYRQLLAIVTPEKRERIGRFFRRADAYLCLFADLLARRELSRETGRPPASFSFTVNAHGKPAVADVPGFHFNASHSGNWAVCAVADGEVGADVEQVGDADLSVSEHFFSGEEHADIMGSAAPGLRFFDYWTLKESYIKFIGRGLTEPLNAFRIRIPETGGIGIELDGQPAENIHFKQYRLDDGHRLAVCAGHDRFADAVEIIAVADLIRELLEPQSRAGG